MRSQTVGMVEVAAEVPVTVSGSAIVADFTDAENPTVRINGRRSSAGTLPELAAALDSGGRRLLSVPLEITTEGPRLVVEQPPGHVAGLSGAILSGGAAESAIAKADRMAAGSQAWPDVPEVTAADLAMLARFGGGERWDGPLVVSMPRTGSTLLGTLFLLLRDPPGSGPHTFQRYVHEPCAPVFWEGRSPDVIADITGGGLTRRDIVQESAYQFAHPELARWFLHNARSPIVFVIRHPQLSWPSRWGIILSMMLADGSAGADAERIEAALGAGNYTGLSDLLTGRIRPPDNGFAAFIALVGMCVAEGIDFTIVDNQRFRDRPGDLLAELCHRWDVAYDDAVTTWQTLAEVEPRVVMGELARGEEYPWYYRATMSSSEGIVRRDRPLVDATAFPEVMRGTSEDVLTIDEAVTWYHLLLARAETIG